MKTNLLLLISLLLLSSSLKGQEEVSLEYTGLNQTLEFSAYAGKNIRLKVDNRVIQKNGDALSGIWYRVITKNGDTLQGEQAINEVDEENTWKQIELSGVLDSLTQKLIIGLFAMNDGEFYFDNFKLEVETKATWETIGLVNSGFESDIINEEVEGWIEGIGYGEQKVKEFKISQSDITEGKIGKSLFIVGSGTNIDPNTLEFVQVQSDWVNKNDEPILLKDINYIDVHNSTVKKASILIDDDKIIDIKKNIKVEENTIIIDGKDKWVMPGLIDSHVHLFQSGGVYTRPDAIDLTEYRPYEKERKWVKKNTPDILKRYLKAGITSIIDIGGPMYNIPLRDTLNNIKEYPNIYLTGPLISTYQPKAFNIESPPIFKVKDSKEAIDLINEQLPYKPDFIKIWYIAENEKDALKNLSIIEATINESHKSNLKVAVHATELYTARLAVKAGADILVHSVREPVDKAFIDLLVKNQTTYIPTLIVSKKYDEVFSQKPSFSEIDFELANPITLGSLQDLLHLNNNKDVRSYKEYGDYQIKNHHPKIQEIQNANLKLIQQANIPVATGTDAGNIGSLHASSYFEELEAMQNAGLSNAEIIKASTLNASKVLNKNESIGSIEKGKIADLIVLNSNPLESLDALKDLNQVIKGGRLYKKDEILKDSPEQLVQKQLNAYNAGEIDAFLAPYSEDVEIYTFPNTLTDKGKAKIKPGYTSLFKDYPDLHCELVNRIVNGNTIIDHEKIYWVKDGKPTNAIAIYKIENNKIAKVYFVRN